MNLIAWLLAACLSTQPDQLPPVTPPAPAVAPVISPAGFAFRDRLEALRPDDPVAYYTLAEEVTDAAAGAADQRLAIELNALAFDMARAVPHTRNTAAAAAIALSELEGTDKARRWLFAMARLVDPTRAEPEWLRKPAPASTESQPYRVATLLGFVRSGDGARARQLLSKPDVRASLLAIDRLLSVSGVAGGVSGIEREVTRWPCPTCGNKLTMRRPGTSPPELRPCSNCGGNPGPILSPEEFILQLRLESWLLQGLQRSWAAQTTADRGEPLIDPDPDSLCSVFGVDPDKVYWRAGRWCATPDCTQPPPPEPAPEPKKPTVQPAKPDAAGQ